jgi:regulator of RNase E activity RraA
MLSDILDDLGFGEQIIKGLSPNFTDAKIFGRAKTLKLRALKDGEDFKGIYNALHSYDSVIPNDIILVENEVGAYAYFGELNANLAIRSGAAGVVVGGNTRDSREVRQLGLPVFSKGYTCQDVRKRATMESMNKRICIEGVSVASEDLVFGDAEGIVVIPRKVEKRIMEEIFIRISNEKQILVDISQGKEVDYLVGEYGFF